MTPTPPEIKAENVSTAERIEVAARSAASSLPRMKFRRETQKQLVTSQIKMMLLRSRSIFYKRNLTEEEKTLTLVKNGVETVVPRRCSHCLAPATQVETMTTDKNYARPLCDDCAAKGK